METLAVIFLFAVFFGIPMSLLICPFGTLRALLAFLNLAHRAGRIVRAQYLELSLRKKLKTTDELTYRVYTATQNTKSLALSTSTQAEIDAHSNSMRRALELHQHAQVVALDEQRSAKDLADLLVSMRALGMTPTALREVEAKLLAANIKASQAAITADALVDCLSTNKIGPECIEVLTSLLHGLKDGNKS